MSRALLLAALVAATAHAADPAADDARYQALIEELRCLVCQNQSIAESNAPLAQDLREQVRLQLAAGKSDQEIADYLTARYGDFVLYRPPFRLRTWLLWLGPFVLLVAAAAVVLRFMRRSRPAAAAAPVDADAVRRLLDEERRRP